MSILEALAWRYATKKFDDTKILSDQKIAVLKQAFNLTPTSYGLQPVKMVIVKNKALQQELVAHSYNQMQVANASHVLVLCIDTTIDSAYIERYFENVKKIRNTPEEVLAPFKNYLLDDFKNKTQDQKDLWAIKQAYITLGNLLTVCATEQIDACPMEGFVPAQYNKVLGLEEKGLSAALVLPVGVRSSEDMFASMPKVRKELSDSVLEI